jgi:hypothetical protein
MLFEYQRSKYGEMGRIPHEGHPLGVWVLTQFPSICEIGL